MRWWREAPTDMEMIGSAASLLIGLVVMIGGPAAYVVLQVRALWRWRGAWRVAALPPLGLIGAAAVYTGRLLEEGSNLAPILIVFAILAGLVWLAVLALVRSQALR